MKIKASKITLDADWIGISEAAGILGVCRQRVQQFIDDGRLVPLGTLFGQYVLSRVAVSRFARLSPSRGPGKAKVFA